MKLVVKNINLLSIPIINAYYKLQEIQTYYYSIKHVANRRDMYNIYLENAEVFLNFNKIDNNKKILDETVFNIQKKRKLKASHKNIQELHPLGFNLLNLTVPFNFKDLKKAYKVAARIYHPDLGGSEENMKIINEAYDLYQNYLLTSNYFDDVDSLEEIDNIFQYKATNANVFYHILYSDIISIYIDEWRLIEAQKLINYLIENDFFQTNLLSKEYSLMLIFLKQLSDLTKKFSSIKDLNSTKDLFEKFKFFKKKYKYSGIGSIFGNIEDIVLERKKNRVIINHLTAAKNAYKMKAISEKKYKELYENVNNQLILTEKINTILNNYLNVNNFLSLPFDIDVKFGFMIDYIPELYYFDDKIVYNLSTQQQYQYFYAFYIKPNVKLIKKYLYVRLSSYILSINSFKNKNFYLNSIIDECILINKLYQETFSADKKSKEFLLSFISDISILENIPEKEYDVEYNIIKEKYYKLLSMNKRKSNIIVNEIFEKIKIIEQKKVSSLIQQHSFINN